VRCCSCASIHWMMPAVSMSDAEDVAGLGSVTTCATIPL
jgi:hypothetical protein